jgi:4-amino-4-deoxy-L-arabinose transferase-like glycosyltransferase
VNWRLLLLLGGALALRLAIAPLPSYWVDEAFTIHLLGQDFGGMLGQLAETESTPPLYYALAWIWSQVSGVGELGLRSLSALAGTATVGFAWMLGRWVAGPRTALAAGALVAVNPFLLWFSTEARAYALATALATGALVLLVRLLARDADDESDEPPRIDGRHFAAWAALAAGALLTHYATAFVIGAQAVILLSRRGTRAAWAAVAAVAAVGAALVPLAVAQRANDFALPFDEILTPLTERLAQIPKQFAIGYDAPLENVAGGATIVLLVLGVVLVLLSEPELRQRALVPLTIGMAGIVAPIAVALTGLDVVSSRYLLPALPPLLVVAAAGFTAGTRSPLGPVLVAGVAAAWLAVSVAVAADPRLQTRADWQGVEGALGPAPAGGRAIVTSPSNGALVLTGAYRLPARYEPPRPVAEIVLAATGEGTAAPPEPPVAAPAFAAAGFRLVERRHERGYVLERWRAKKPVPIDPALVDAASLDPFDSSVLWQP